MRIRAFLEIFALLAAAMMVVYLIEEYKNPDVGIQPIYSDEWLQRYERHRGAGD